MMEALVAAGLLVETGPGPLRPRNPAKPPPTTTIKGTRPEALAGKYNVMSMLGLAAGSPELSTWPTIRFWIAVPSMAFVSVLTTSHVTRGVFAGIQP
jgi:hypothetical protein